MATFDLIQVPTVLQMQLMGNTGAYPSPLIASAQTIDRGGLKWSAVYSYDNISKVKRGELFGLIASLRGQANRIRVPVYDNPRRGAYGGTPLVNGAAQTGSSIDIKGCSNNITDWIMSGDYFSLVVNGEHELKMCTADASSDGAGLATISFEPRLRASPANSAIIFVGDGVLARPQGIFHLTNSSVGWSSRPFQSTSEMSSLSIAFTEDVFATQ